VNVTVLVVTLGHREALQLAVDSLRHHNKDVSFAVWCWVNEPADDGGDARRWAEANCDRVFYKTEDFGHYHGRPLDVMSQAVRTPYTLTIDNDVWVKQPFLADMIRALEGAGNHSFVACAPPHEHMGTVDHFGRLLHGRRRIDPACALFRAEPLARMTGRVTFSPYECTATGSFYDTGGMLLQAAEGAGFAIAHCPWLWERVTHFGCLTWAGNAPAGTRTKQIGLDRLDTVRAAAKEFYMAVPQEKEIVVAKYQEDTSWVENLPYKVTVYDKSGGVTGNAVKLPNVGREAHTYAEHVARRYDDLADVTVFTQGRPHDHVPNFTSDVQEPVVRFTAYGQHTLESFATGDSCHPGLPLADLFCDLTRRCMPPKVTFKPGAIFAATRDTLRQYPQAWWRRLADKLADPETQSWAPWTMERLWKELLVGARMPHFYQSLAGWMDYEDLYARVAREVPDGARLVEVGSYHGRSVAYLAVELVNSGKNFILDAVDTFQGSEDPQEKFMKDEAAANGGSFRCVFDKNIEPVKHVVNVVQQDSVSAAGLYADGSVDFCFIDAAHDEDSVAADIAAWLPKVKPGGLLSGHDYSAYWPGVKAAVDNAFGGNHQMVSVHCWGYRKPLNSP
jgi:hypothetical protein